MEIYPWFILGLYTRCINVFRLYHVYHMYIHMISNVYVAGFRSSWREGGWEEIEAQAATSECMATDSVFRTILALSEAWAAPVVCIDNHVLIAHCSTITISMWRVRPVFDTRPTRSWVNKRSKSSESQWVKIFILGLSHGYTMFKPCINSVYPFRNHPSHVSVPYRQIWRGDPGQSAWIWSFWSSWEFQRLHLSALNAQVPLTACGSSTHIASTTQCSNICQPSSLSG